MHLARQQYSWLGDGDEPEPATEPFAQALARLARQDPAVAIEGAAAVFAMLTGLLVTFIGEPLTAVEGGRVAVSVERAGAEMEVKVVDTGRGIDADFLPHVFERFRQADRATSRSYGGLGLGLTIVGKIVELHGGTVKAESQGEGRGAIFTIRLPIPTVEARANRWPGRLESPPRPRNGRLGAPTSPLQQVADRLDGIHILLIDDDADGRELVTLVLTGLGARVTAVGSARDARQVLAGQQPDVLVSDIGMSDEDGYVLIRQIRQHEAEHGGFLPAIALTGVAGDDERSHVLAAGFQAHVPKPLDPAELSAAITRAARGPSRAIADYGTIET